MFRIFTNGVEPTLADMEEVIKSTMCTYNMNLFQQTDVIFVGSNKDRHVEVSKMTEASGLIVTKTYMSKGCLTENLDVRYYKDGDYIHQEKITNDPSWVVEIKRQWYPHGNVLKTVTVYVNPKTINLVDFTAYFMTLLEEQCKNSEL
mgnify:FL=1|jgi:hypothetical protein|nr:MAG TPA: hypothetical protein [Bacteriophage sp.]